MVKDDPEELVDVFQTDWFTRANSKMAPGDSIRIYRENFGFSQAELGSKLGGVPRQNVSAMERGHRGISKDMAKRLSEIFSVPVARFL